jgi:phosphatidylserine/phosphatidylglycerophosphate/cardiolipin synthase-like enzyme
MRPIARPGETCWRTERAERATVLFDADEYFSAACAVLRKARHSILLLGWDFDPRTDLAPRADSAEAGLPLAALLEAITTERPDLHVRILIWDMVLPISILRFGYPQRSRMWFDGRIEFELDAAHPYGACHHQKVLVVDDSIAFCGGTDFATDRWDSVEHRDDDPRRRLPSGRPHPARHDLMMMVEGPAARALGDLARERWYRATGRRLMPSPATSPSASLSTSPPTSRSTSTSSSPTAELWPQHCATHFTDVDVAIARTQPEEPDTRAVAENLGLYLAALGSARKLIYLENQYVVAPEIERALSARLAEADGPEVVLMCGAQSPSYFDRLAIDDAQQSLIGTLRAADRFDRFRAYTPLTAGGEPIIVHSKAAVIDDRLLRIGSTNLNNRSLGLDTECDVAIDAAAAGGANASTCAAIEAVRARMLAHHLDVNPEELSAAMARHGSAIAAIESLQSARLRSADLARPPDDSPLRTLIAEYHLGDPQGVNDLWRPWRRVETRTD